MKRGVRKADRSPIAHDVLAYLAKHPHAQDTLEGITYWWLLEQEVIRRMAEVQAALTDLVAEGLIVERRGKDGSVHYRVNPAKSEEIIASLRV